MKDKDHHHGHHGFRHHHHRGRFEEHGFHSGDLPGGRKLSSDDLQLVILGLLSEKAAHGYELIKAISERSAGFYTPSPGVIYPALMYLHEVGYAKLDQDGARKLYGLTPEGAAYLDTNRPHAQRILDMLSRMGGRMADVRDAFAGAHEFDSDNSNEVQRARHALKDALKSKRGCGPEEAVRFARILDRAASEIKSNPQPVDQAGFRSAIQDARVLAVIHRLLATRRPPLAGGMPGNAHDYAEHGFSISPEQGDLIYLLCRAMGARRVVDFATSVGMSALYFAAALRDNGGGKVIGSELVPAKVLTAQRNLAEAGLAEYAEIREGDARQTLTDLGGPVDFVLIDGWPQAQGPSLARQVIEIVAPQLRRGGYILNDNAEPDFLEYVRNPANGFVTVTLPIKRGTELCAKIAG